MWQSFSKERRSVGDRIGSFLGESASMRSLLPSLSACSVSAQGGGSSKTPKAQTANLPKLSYIETLPTDVSAPHRSSKRSRIAPARGGTLCDSTDKKCADHSPPYKLFLRQLF